MHSGRVRIEVPGKVPVSLNKIGGRPNPAAWRRFKALWTGLFLEQLLAAQSRGELPAISTPSRLDEPPEGQLDFVEAAGAVRFNIHRKRDEGNFRAPIEKALGDALTGGDRAVWPHGRWLPDDTSEHYRFQGFAISVDRAAEPKTVVEFEWRRGSLF